MDTKEFSERATRLQEIGAIIEKLPAEIRSEAFSVLKAYASRQSDMLIPNGGSAEGNAVRGDSLFGKFNHDRPSDNVRLIAAYLYQEFGSESFSVDEVKTKASDAGITIPGRVDMTLAAAQENEKHLFARAGRGRFKPTVHGELFLKTTYGVTKGTKKRDSEDK